MDREFIKVLKRLPLQDRKMRIHIYLKHPGLPCGTFACKLPEDMTKKLAINKALKG